MGSNFGLAKLKQEGAPVHPDDLDWSHCAVENCPKCEETYKRQLAAWEAWERKEGRLGVVGVTNKH